MLKLNNVKKTYKTKSGQVYALNGVSLDFAPTGMVFITGKSGCGKTTLLNVIGGLDSVDEGEISVLGKSFSSFSSSEYDSYRNTFIGFVFQEYNLLPEFSVEKNIKIALELQGSEFDKTHLDELLDVVEIKDLKNRKPNELSGGQRQRVAIARALIKQPRIILADEPTGALDSSTGVQVLDILKKLSKDKLVIVVSHDQEFAEKYADRIIRLVDGKVVEDFSFNDKEIKSNIRDTEETFIVKDGAELSSDEKDELALAIKNRRKIEITPKVTYREKQNTENVQTITEKDVKLKGSKMKLKSSLALGVKSLGVKPFRLVFTILLSAVAFAVFGLFDTVANFSTTTVINNLMRTTPYPTIATYGKYVLNNEEADSYEFKLSDESVNEITQQTGFEALGVYDFEDNTAGFVRPNYTISEIARTDVTLGKNYYSNTVNGIVEFDASDIDKDGNLGKFGYKLVQGEYPSFRYDTEGKLIQESTKEIAISTYLAQSITHYLNGQGLYDVAVDTYQDVVNNYIMIDGTKYKVVGLIDCGEIPEKYEVLKTSTISNMNLRTISEDFSTYVNSGALKCMFAPKGFLKNLNDNVNGLTYYFGGDAKWKASTISTKYPKSTRDAYEHVFCIDEFDQTNVLLFSGLYTNDGTIPLNDNQVIIHSDNLKYLFNNEYIALTGEEKDVVSPKIKDLQLSIYDLDYKKQTLESILSIFGYTSNTVDAKLQITKTSEKTGEKITKTLDVVGVYFGVETNKSTGSAYKFVMTKNLMNEFEIFPSQGEYSRIILSPKANLYGTKYLASKMTEESGFVLNWYGNSVLATIQVNETAVRQSADLFLYVALVLAAFSVFMFFNYITTSIVNKRQSIGVLRGLGSNRKDILLMFICESIIIALINAILATVFTAVGCIFVNMYINNVMNITIPFAIFGARQGLLIFGISVITALISSILPIIKISNEKPVDLIRKF